MAKSRLQLFDCLNRPLASLHRQDGGFLKEAEKRVSRDLCLVL